MRVSVFILLLLNALFGFSQKELKEFYLNRSLKQDGQQFQFKVLDDDKRGVWFYKKDKFYHWYKAQHVMSTQGASAGVLLHGTFEAFYPNKQLAQRGRFQKGLKSGEWLYWREDGTLLRSEHWRNGVLRGQQKTYNEHGVVSETVVIKRWSNERLAGDTLIQTKGNKERITLFDDRGRVAHIEERKFGELHGKVNTYEEGKLIESKRYKNGEERVKKEKESKEAETEAVDEEKEPFFKRLFKKKEKSQDDKPKSEKKSREEKKSGKNKGKTKRDKKKKEEER